MKKLFLVAIAVIFGSGYSFGQFTLGVRAGYNGNKLATDLSSIETQFSNGFHMGIFSRIGKRIYVAPAWFIFHPRPVKVVICICQAGTLCSIKVLRICSKV